MPTVTAQDLRRAGVDFEKLLENEDSLRGISKAIYDVSFAMNFADMKHAVFYTDRKFRLDVDQDNEITQVEISQYLIRMHQTGQLRKFITVWLSYFNDNGGTPPPRVVDAILRCVVRKPILVCRVARIDPDGQGDDDEDLKIERVGKIVLQRLHATAEQNLRNIIQQTFFSSDEFANLTRYKFREERYVHAMRSSSPLVMWGGSTSSADLLKSKAESVINHFMDHQQKLSEKRDEYYDSDLSMFWIACIDEDDSLGFDNEFVVEGDVDEKIHILVKKKGETWSRNDGVNLDIFSTESWDALWAAFTTWSLAGAGVLVR